MKVVSFCGRSKPARASAADPVTYRLGEVQYIAVASGMGRSCGGIYGSGSAVAARLSQWGDAVRVSAV